MDVIRINDLFSPEDIISIVEHFNDNPEDNENFSISEELGRYQFPVRRLSENIQENLLAIANSISDFDCGFSGATYAEYNSKYGTPRLPPHFDGDWNDLIINYQLTSNTDWSIGVDLNVYEMKDNSALVFNPNKNVHWRPRKIFHEGEFVRMIFFRFYNSKNISDYSHLNQQEYKNFEDINQFRDSVSGDGLHGPKGNHL